MYYISPPPLLPCIHSQVFILHIAYYCNMLGVVSIPGEDTMIIYNPDFDHRYIQSMIYCAIINIYLYI